MGTCYYYLWQVMAEEFRSDTFDLTEKEMGGFGDASYFLSILDKDWILRA